MTQREFNRRFKAEVKKMTALVSAKNRDYAGNDDALRNFKLIEVVTGGRLSIEDGMILRICDKLQRVENLLKPGVKRCVDDERVTDTLRDAANYFVIWKVIREYLYELEPGPKPPATPRRGDRGRRPARHSALAG